ncbi:MAG: ATP-dependent helicase [Thermomicrobiales bacterium]|nr:ATP-dependent helicase [Thermomicrobiales bacterium]MCO5224350.1 ATP-dependent helicase [Thermomicrobiales bacterium]MCO5228282.1 ATP-dependent helicase [Thermomicrobiales bacterium]
MAVKHAQPNLAPRLDQYQHQVVTSMAPAIRMVAPAGSGKTETLAHRVMARIEVGVQPNRILLLTFDTNARDSILAKLSALGAPTGVDVSTINAFGFRLLRERFRDERTRIMREVFFPQSPSLRKLTEEYGHSVFTEMLSKIKNEAIDTRSIDRTELARWCSKKRDFLLRSLEDDPILADLTDTQFGRELAGEMLAYEQFLQSRNGIDFDDQKLRSYLRLNQDSSALAWLQDLYDDVVVDEFQDVNRLDALLIDQIAGESNLLITGDDDQAIYGFRGATASFLIEPQTTFGRAFESYELSINYRCPPRILRQAGMLISHNEHRIDKQPRASKQIAGEIEVIAEQDIEGECRAVVQRMQALLAAESRTGAILVRRRAQMPAMQAALIRANLPYRVADVKDDLRVSWSLVRRLLLLAPLTLGEVPDEETRREIVDIFCRARFMDDHRRTALMRAAAVDDLSFPGAELQQQLHARERNDLTTGLRALVGEMSVADRIRKLDALLNTEQRTYMEGGNELKRNRGDRDVSRLSSLEDLARYRQNGAAAFAAHLDDLLKPQRTAVGAGSAMIELLTCHGAKGREWQIVCIPHCNQGVFPDSRSEEGEHLEAERKLFYVSMTRASEHLIMSWSRDRANSDPSTFLIEAEMAKPRQKVVERPTVYRFSDMERKTPPVQKGRKLSPNGQWAMSAPVAKPKGPVPRYLTLVSRFGRLMKNVLQPDAIDLLVAEVNRLQDEKSLSLVDIEIRYARSDPASTLPLQLALAFHGIPFAITGAHRMFDQSVYAEAVLAWEQDIAADVAPRELAIVDILAAQLEQHTGSDDAWIWLQRLEEQEQDDAYGSNAKGVRLIAQ